MTALFRRKGANGHYCGLYEDLTTAQRNLLERKLRLAETELPVIASAKDDNSWFLLTSMRLAWESSGSAGFIPIEEICDAAVDLQGIAHTGKTKLQIDQIEIISSAGGEYKIEVEPGAPFLGVLHIFKNIAHRNNALRLP
jgi:hypothetical protein